MPHPPCRLAALAAVALALAPAACGAPDEAPASAGVCYFMTDAKGGVGGVVVGTHRFQQVAEGVPDLEHCAAALEAVRLRFLNLGGSVHAITGAYQGQFLFLDARGVFSAPSLQATPFPTLVRTDDGRLVPPGSAATNP